MTSCLLNNMAITVEKESPGHFTKSGYPIRFGKYSEIRTSAYEFQFNPKGEIKFIRGLTGNWPHPAECLKRTDGNDWVYYSVRPVGGRNISTWLGEYYLPCLTYSSNSILEFNPFTDPEIMKAFAAWSQLYANIHGMRRDGAPVEIKNFLDLITDNDENALHEHSEELHSTLGGWLSVLPPDSRHVDYEVIPLIIADGCLYHCDFCCVKSDRRFQPRSRSDILRQIQQLKTFYHSSLGNYKALFLGNHDALGAGRELITLAALEAARAFGLDKARSNKALLLLFGSVDSLLKTGDELLETLNHLPFHTYINVGFESVDPPTLAGINKPLEISRIRDAFRKMLEVNRDYDHVEITANFLLGERLSPEHNQSLAELLHDVPDPFQRKGAIYLSPLMDRPKTPDLLDSFFEIKNMSRLPTYIYLIQRL